MSKFLILVILVILFYIFARIVANTSVFEEKIHQLYRDLKRILISREYGMTDRFDDARDFIKSKNLSDYELNKLRTCIQIERERFTTSFPYGAVLVSVFITFTTLMIGTSISTTVGGLFGALSNNLYSKKYDVAQVVYADLMEFANEAAYIIAAVFIFGIMTIGTWRTYSKYLSEITLSALRVVEQELEERIEERKRQDSK
ncbi:hypothetical protein POF51_07885 [Brevibacillus sp. AG]|uniref:hypothetical protein n=1 Tax=Brevibacillus sp. AG TaxID=3020891 RepID=UPI00232C40CA|nr:hypothetical protein [Brevibacillus sp. AG]MDC0760606.1 hypothetical protein [Brevibacillus sp. AG]